MGWLIAIGVLVLLAFLPLGVRAVYNAQGLFVGLIVGPVSIRIFPASKASNQKRKQEGTTKGKQPKKDESGGSLSDFKPLVRLLLTMLEDFRRKLRVSCLEFRLVLADPDPCDLSLQYGKAWAILGNVLPQLERIFVIKRRKLDICCDYTAVQSSVYARVDLTICFGRLLYLAARHGFPILKEYQNIINSRKGGAKL